MSKDDLVSRLKKGVPPIKANEPSFYDLGPRKIPDEKLREQDLVSNFDPVVNMLGFDFDKIITRTEPPDAFEQVLAVG